MYGVLISVVTLKAGNERLPDAPLHLGHGGGLQVPAVKIADDGDLGRIGSPNPEQIAFHVVLILGRMGAETLPGVGGAALGKGLKLQIKVVRREFF